MNWDDTPKELKERVPTLKDAQTEATTVHIFFTTNKDDQRPRNAMLLMDQLGLPHP